MSYLINFFFFFLIYNKTMTTISYLPSQIYEFYYE